MSTKNSYVKGTSKPFNVSDSFHNNQYRNFNMNNSTRDSAFNNQISIKNNSNFNGKKFKISANNTSDLEINHDSQTNKVKNLWHNKNGEHSKKPEFLTFRDCEKETQKRWQKEDTDSGSANSSTISLHIAAYQNSIESGVTQNNNNNNNPLKTKQFFSSDFYETPRQQDDQPVEPEVMQYKSSQKLLNPNEASSSKSVNKKSVNKEDKKEKKHHEPTPNALMMYPMKELVFKGPFIDVVTSPLSISNPTEKTMGLRYPDGSTGLIGFEEVSSDGIKSTITSGARGGEDAPEDCDTDRDSSNNHSNENSEQIRIPAYSDGIIAGLGGSFCVKTVLVFAVSLITVIHAADNSTVTENPAILFLDGDVDQQLSNDDSSNTNSDDKKSSSSSSSTVYIVLVVIFFIIMVVSLGLMVYCIRKYRNKRKELMSKAKKVLNGGAAGGPGVAGAAGKAQSTQSQSQQAQKKLSVSRVPPKEIKISGKSSASISAKANAALAKKSQPIKSPSETTTTTTATTTTTTTNKTASKTKKMALKKENKSERDVEPTQISSHLEAIGEDEELKLSKGKMIQKTFLCVNGKDWHEPQTGEADDFSFEIESGNTFSMISN